MPETQTGRGFEVNGQVFETDRDTLTATTILEDAKKKGMIPREPGDYVLHGDKGDYRGNEEVNLNEDSVFITIPTGATPVA